ncbi:ECF transporter S component [Candidatus Epulonipiscium fishelsonii]|uniref:ECF transporter S component n=1 Tax=Candidatus Epulonipiscium fishelsonii TaxID=77094 RepID=A0ACC8XDS8_9FIRM|nr:ECF transporter S component [Epulopiscium sp. SCG-B05WGA-EpuloA1]ONI41076.1 ECF transporter S component [Epulopiscium sp. SCG-B11WGA-EpuloA1]
MNTKSLTFLGVLLAMEIILSFTPLGFIPLGFTNATTVHIPVIIGAIVLGLKGGIILGGAFGIMSVIIATTRPTLTSFVFSPFITIGGMHGNIFSLFIAIVPRIMIGVTAYYTYKLLKSKSDKLAYVVAGVVGSLTNTILVLGSIYLFFGKEFAQVNQVEIGALFGVIMGIIGVNGVPEAIVAGVLVTTICTVLKSAFKLKFS